MTQDDGQQEGKISIYHFLERWGWWAVPIILFASFFIWEEPFTSNPPYAFPFYILRIGQITGIISSLFLGIWGLTVFRNTSFLGRAGFGMLGIGLAATILNSITDSIAYLVAITAGFQMIWLIVVWLYEQKQPLKDGRKIRGDLIEARISLFGKGYTWMEIGTRWLISILFFISMIGFGYCQLFQHRNGFCFYGGKTMAWSLVLFWIMFGLILIHPNVQKLEIRILGNPYRLKNEIHKAILSEMKDLTLFCIHALIVSIAALVFGMTSRSYPGYELFYWISVVVLVAPFYCIVYWLILYRFLHRAVQGERFGYTLESLRNIYLDHPELRRFVLGFPIPYHAMETADEIQVEELTGPTMYSWESIRHIWADSVLIRFVLETNNTIVGPVKLKGKWNKTRREALFRLWGDKTYFKNPTEFVHPERYRIRDAWYNRVEPWFYVVLGLVFVSMWIIAFHHARFKSQSEFLFALGVCGILVLGGAALSGYGVYRLIHKIRVLNQISIQDKLIRMKFTDGAFVEFDASNIVKIEYSRDPRGYHLHVKGIPVIRNLDKVSYFGVLKRRLDEMMAKREKGV